MPLANSCFYWRCCNTLKDQELKLLMVQRKERCPIFNSQSHQILIKTFSRRNGIKNWLHNVVFVNLCSGFDTTLNQTNNILYLLSTGNYICSSKLKRGAFWYLPLAWEMRQRQLETIGDNFRVIMSAPAMIVWFLAFSVFPVYFLFEKLCSCIYLKCRDFNKCFIRFN